MKKLNKLSCALLIAGLGFSMSAMAKVTVFAAASMTNALQQVADEYQKQNPNNPVVFSFASSSTLAKQIEQGAPADVFVSASTNWLKYLSDKNLTVKNSEKILVGNELVLIAPINSTEGEVNIKDGKWIAQLDNNYIAVGDPDHVPAGQYAKESLTNLGLWDKVEPRISRAKDVRGALALVERQESPYGIVYGTDAKISQNVKVVGTFPQESYTAVQYPVAILKDHDNKDSQDFLKYLESDNAKQILESYGFTFLAK